MIGNRISWGSQGYTILEQGEINRDTLELEVTAWLVCQPNGEEVGSYPSLGAARDAIDQGATILPRPNLSGSANT